MRISAADSPTALRGSLDFTPAHPGAKPVSAGEARVTCRKGQEVQKGNSLVKGVWKDGTWTLVWARPLPAAL